jgi:twitching motility protein PilT
LRRSDGQGRIAACEILLVTLKAREVIREGDRYAELHDIIDAGAAQGMCVFDARIAELLAAGHISREVALANASNRAELERRLTMG